MADFERRELEIGLKFGHLSFDKRTNFSEGSFKPKKYAQVIRVFNSNYLFVFAQYWLSWRRNTFRFLFNSLI